jgi:long-chain acyl-CoA synthetase
MDDARPWLRHYPPGTPADIDPQAYASVNEVFLESCRRFGPEPALESFGRRMSYGELESASRDLAAWLAAAPGVAPGERIAIMLPNLLQYPVATFAALRAGLVVVNVNPLYTAHELRHVLQDSGARVVLVLENFAATLQQALPGSEVRHVLVTRLGDLLGAKGALLSLAVKHLKKLVPPWRIEGAVGLPAALKRGRSLPLPEHAPRGEDLAFIQYTGGTTGRSKGAMLTHANLVANLLQCRAWIGGTLLERQEIVLTPLPLYHVFSLVANLLTFMTLGGRNVLIANPRDLPAFVKLMRATPWTVMTGVNTLYNALASTAGFGPQCARAAKLSVGGGAAIQRPVAERWQAATGAPLIEGYGLTEATAAVAITPPGMSYTGSVGVPISSTRVSIRRDDGTECAAGEAGEICVQGPQVMRGYWRAPEATAEIMLPGGWLRTGDVGTLDEAGWVRITDRKKDMILVSGFNVYPAEVEAAAVTHPAVLEAAAIGVPDERSGEAVKLFVVPRPGQVLEAAALDAHLRDRLTAYKCPRQIEFRTELPKTPIGKILRRLLREPAATPPA